MTHHLHHKTLLILAGSFLMASCSVSKKIDKAKDILHDNRQEAAAFCALEFPDSTVVIVTVDSSGYNESVNDLQKYSDSILSESDARLRAINNLTAYVETMEDEGKYDAGMINELQAKLDAIKPVNVAALRADIEKKIRASIKPCKDSIIKEIPTAQIDYWKMESKNHQDRADKFEAKNSHKGKVIWWLIIYAVGMTIFAFRKIIFKLLI